MQPQAIEKSAATPADAVTAPKPGALTRMRRSPYFFPLIGLVAVSIVMVLTTLVTAAPSPLKARFMPPAAMFSVAKFWDPPQSTVAAQVFVNFAVEPQVG